MSAKPLILAFVLVPACAPAPERPASSAQPVAPAAVAGLGPGGSSALPPSAEPAKESGCIYADQKADPKSALKPEGCPHEDAPTETLTANPPGQFGTPISAGAPTPLSRAMAVEIADGATVKVSGVIDSVCQKMGCWLVLKDGEQTARVLMKDHGFTVPLDSRGKSAVVEGTVKSRTFSEAQVKHLEEDAGKDPAKVSGTRREVVLTASGIRI
jgi:hypothetical protein